MQINQIVKSKTKAVPCGCPVRAAKQARFDLLVRRVLLLPLEMRRANQKVQSWGSTQIGAAITERALDGELCGGLLALSSEFAQHQIVHIFSAAPNVKTKRRRHRRRNVYFYQAPAKMPWWALHLNTKSTWWAHWCLIRAGRAQKNCEKQTKLTICW